MSPKKLAAVVLFIFSFVVLCTAASFAHTSHTDWQYDQECCHEKDCRPARPGEVQEVRGGWLVTQYQEFIAYDSEKVRKSPDGAFHVCAYEGEGVEPYVLCLYVPPPNS